MVKETEDKDKNLDPCLLKIAERIKELRLNAGYSSHENFAWDHGINRVQYWRIEKGSNITLQTLLKICDIHKITVKEFFEDF